MAFFLKPLETFNYLILSGFLNISLQKTNSKSMLNIKNLTEFAGAKVHLFFVLQIITKKNQNYYPFFDQPGSNG
ncbi:MAG: hypothetical protein WBH71_05915 [Bacteroidales bacterium]|jgi:hypothetical protein|nr:hypothetical protein [Bacteroidales bacterium]MDI9592755.1 hypothetical protein [Bacteroidota bacterium]HOF81032.1 hypothetical protein [Bacteroidales bacterium]HOR76629.1 hypothetical protein [Bacteroidales bacterium]HPL11744.1 hypothetical protein [Bacteroidales bacterium]